MELGRLRVGEWVSAASAVALLAVLPLPWFEAVTERGRLLFRDDLTERLSAWQAFAVVDLVLVLFAGLGLGVAALAASRRSPAAPVAAAVIAAATGIVLTVVLALRLLFPPGPNALVELEYGGLLGLLGVIGITAGAWIVIRDERTEAVEPPFVPAQPAPPAFAPAGSLVAEGGVPDAADRD